MTDASPEQIVIVGAGEAGARAAISLRAEGYAGRLILIGEERHAPYERPPLSKAAMVEANEPAPPTIGDAANLSSLTVEHIADVAVEAIERGERRLRLADGRRLAYDRLVLATGARARTLPGAEGVLTLRSFEDAVNIRSRLKGAKRVAIVGGGFIGLELASSARTLGCAVTLLEADTRLLRRSTPEALADALEARHRREGVEIIKGARIERFEASAQGVVVHLADRAIEADVIIAGVGAAPRTELAEAAGLAIDNGVAVDAQLRTSDPHIFAIGDCASFPHVLFDGRRLRLEAWRNAFDQGAHVAKTLLGASTPFAAVPYFWSDQYDITLQMTGLADAAATTVARELGGGATMLFHLDATGRLIGAGALGSIDKVGREIKLAERLIARRATPAPAKLADASVGLKRLL